jgi:hypothetical protein
MYSIRVCVIVLAPILHKFLAAKQGWLLNFFLIEVQSSLS